MLFFLNLQLSNFNWQAVFNPIIKHLVDHKLLLPERRIDRVFNFQKFMHKIRNIKEAFIAAAIIIGFTGLISFLPLKFEFLKAIRQDVYGFDIYDLYYTEKHKNNLRRDTNIILVQIEDERDKIAHQINILRACNPDVIGIDAVFDNRKNPAEDSAFLQSIANAENIVFATRLEIENGQLTPRSNFFDTINSGEHSGYINFVGNQYSVIRTYAPFLNSKGKAHFSFSSRIIQLFSPGSFDTLKWRKHPEEIINYTGNTEKYTSITKEELLEYAATHQLSGLFKNKIVLLGYFIKYPPFVLQDLHFSPLNEQFAGKSFPDMYGVVIHANILSMILERNYANLASNTASYLYAFLITFLFLLYIIHLHSKKNHPAHAKILLIQFLLILFVLYFFLELYSLFLWKLPLLPVLISLVLCIELLGLYKIIALWLHKKTGYATVFNHK